MTVRPRLAPVDRASAVFTWRSVDSYGLAVTFHRQLLDVCGEPTQALAVRQHCDGRNVEEGAVPYIEQPHEHRKILCSRCGAEMLIHRMEPIKHGPKLFGADRDHGGETDRRVHGVAATDPIPEAELPGDSKRSYRLVVRRDGNHLHAHTRLPQGIDQPGTDTCGVHHGLDRGERLRRNDDQACCRIDLLQHSLHIGWIDVRDEVEGQCWIDELTQCLIGHRRPKIGSTDTDIDDRREPFTRE